MPLHLDCLEYLKIILRLFHVDLLKNRQYVFVADFLKILLRAIETSYWVYFQKDFGGYFKVLTKWIF